MHLISTEKHTLDNQVAIEAFQSPLRSMGHHITREIIWLVNQVQKHMRRSKRRYGLTMH